MEEKKIIRLGVCYNNDRSDSFDIYKDGNPERILWSQTSLGLGHEFYCSFLNGEQSRKEYEKADLIEVIPLEGIGTRPAKPEELGGLVSSIAETVDKDVLLKFKPKKLEEIK